MYVIISIIGLIGCLICLVIQGRIKRKYRAFLRRGFLVLAIFFSSGILSLGLSFFFPDYGNEEDIQELNDQIASLKQQATDAQEKIDSFSQDSLDLLSSSEYQSYYQEYTSLKEQLDQYTQELQSLQEEYQDRDREYQKLYDETSYWIDDVITYHQYPNYPNGCESVALYILLQYYDVDVTVEEIVEALPKGSSPHRVNGVLYAGNPLREFVGDPRLYTGYGVYDLPIEDVANQFKEGIINFTGASLDEVLETVSNDHPVQVWVSINLEDTDVCMSWIDEDTGEKVDWICDLHSLVVVGYDYQTIIVSDPYTGEIEEYDRDQFEKMYELFGRRALYYEE